MQARDIMTTGVITVGPDAEVAEITKCLLDNRISAVPVVESDGRLVGIVSEGDLIRRPEMGTERRRSWWLSLLLLPEHSAIDYIKTHGRHARDVMTRELITVNDDALLEEIAEILEKHRIKRVPVVHDGSLSASSAGPISCTASSPAKPVFLQLTIARSKQPLKRTYQMPVSEFSFSTS